MATVKQKHPNEHFDALLRRFKKLVDSEDIIKEFRRHEFFEKPSFRRKTARAAAVKRAERTNVGDLTKTKRLY